MQFLCGLVCVLLVGCAAPVSHSYSVAELETMVNYQGVRVALVCVVDLVAGAEIVTCI